MAIKARETITIIKERDVNATWRFYRIASSTSTPSQPTEAQGKAYVNNQTVPSGWSVSEPAYDGSSTNSLYTCDLTSFTDGGVSWSVVSKSSSYEAAKQAYNEAQNAKKVATNFMSADTAGIMVADMRNGSSQTPSNPSGRNVLIDSDSVDIRNGSDVLASFGSAAVIGQQGESQVQIDYNSLQMIDKEGDTIFLVSDLRDRSGYATVEEDFYNSRYILLTFRSSEILQVVADGVTLTTDEYELDPEDGQQIILDDQYDEISVQYKTNRIVTAYTLGSRHSFGRVGANSVAMGRQLIASRPFAVALGSSNEAGGLASLATGVSTEALGSYSAAFGSDGCASGFASVVFGLRCSAPGRYAIAEGEYCSAEGENSHAMNEGTIAHRLSQTVLGRYNIMETGGTAVKGKYALIIGNGTSDSDRSNALTVDWDGHVQAAGMAGIVQMFAGATAPTGWLICNGAAVSRTTYARLFAVIGTTYGAGDGSTTFNLPDFRDRFPVGTGSTYALNSKGGANSVTLTTNTIPAHTHGKSGAITSGITSSGAHTHTFKTQADYAAKGTKKGIYSESDGTWTGTSVMTSTGAHTHNLPAHEHTSVGGGQAHENRPPYLGINFIICTGKTDL